jgi:hypothetical protein
MADEIDVRVRSQFGYEFPASSLPPGITDEPADPDTGKVRVLLNNDNINDLWLHIDAARRTELVEGRYVVVLKGPGARTAPITPANQPAGTEASPEAIRRARGAAREKGKE